MYEERRVKEVRIYPNIDMHRTGIRLKKLIENRGYSVTDIQEYLHLSCPQPVYRWFQGKILPSVDHLLMLSELLGVHMEELLVKKQHLQQVPYGSSVLPLSGAQSAGTWSVKTRSAGTQFARDMTYIIMDSVMGTVSDRQGYLLEWVEQMRQDEDCPSVKCRMIKRLEMYYRKLKDMAA